MHILFKDTKYTGTSWVTSNQPSTKSASGLMLKCNPATRWHVIVSIRQTRGACFTYSKIFVQCYCVICTSFCCQCLFATFIYSCVWDRCFLQYQLRFSGVHVKICVRAGPFGQCGRLGRADRQRTGRTASSSPAGCQMSWSVCFLTHKVELRRCYMQENASLFSKYSSRVTLLQWRFSGGVGEEGKVGHGPPVLCQSPTFVATWIAPSWMLKTKPSMSRMWHQNFCSNVRFFLSFWGTLLPLAPLWLCLWSSLGTVWLGSFLKISESASMDSLWVLSQRPSGGRSAPLIFFKRIWLPLLFSSVSFSMISKLGTPDFACF